MPYETLVFADEGHGVRKPENLRVVEAALKRAGVPYETLVFADEGHGVRKPENLRVLYARLIEFFNSAFAG